MKYLGAYLLATLGGNASPSAQDVLKVLEAGGLDCDMENANSVVDALKGKTISEVIAQGKVKLSSVPSGGSAPAAAAPSGGAAPKAEEKKKEEPKEESDDDMGFGLFD
ncbi:Large ribosomal subunit protein P2 [Caenorhabditis elegans]|uniref:Large ribosomal subunit protein P2 n=1 Tax=Caenorhabditis elegans TaxID=6239 RepID=RLA2_CAEEL|nr:Large ribosomal subunit protein P2 [Caenorhabditis elegans]O01504.2 RecName: Full=Large ribosomal subunit protein P2; AltName: Full=60S acidic ribosomal protein P2 [Caenorhabditis elegans]CCD66926.1 Large ribosomal subunit protein P2 [Caenorhabditis elegans]|eukprot:NP_491944.2 60S acidic ribosomal protein P2 [Caenorhabditis elegans]